MISVLQITRKHFNHVRNLGPAYAYVFDLTYNMLTAFSA